MALDGQSNALRGPALWAKHAEHLFLATSGRIPRRVFWWGISAVLAAQLAFTLFLARVAGVGWVDYTHGAKKVAVINLVALAFFFWPSLAVSIKRLHDRNTSGWWAALFHVMMLMFYVQIALGRPPGRDPVQNFIMFWPGFVFVLLGGWLAIELVLLRGTRGHNRFGPDPDAPAPVVSAPGIADHVSPAAEPKAAGAAQATAEALPIAPEPAKPADAEAPARPAVASAAS